MLRDFDGGGGGGFFLLGRIWGECFERSFPTYAFFFFLIFFGVFFFFF